MFAGFSFSSFVGNVAIYFSVHVLDPGEQKLSNVIVPLKKLTHLQIRSKCGDLINDRNVMLR